MYLAYCLVLFTALGLTCLTVNLFLPSLRRRRLVAGVVSRVFLRLAGIPFAVVGTERLPRGPCVVVANHASYIDGLVAAAALPPDFAFVIKKEMVRVPLAGLLLRRLGSQFVERFDRHKGGVDARRVVISGKMAAPLLPPAVTEIPVGDSSETSGATLRLMRPPSRTVGVKVKPTPYCSSCSVIVVPPAPLLCGTGINTFPPARKLASCPLIAIRFGSARILTSWSVFWASI